MSLDPLAFFYPDISPYNYVGGNPLIFIDPDGKDWYRSQSDGSMKWQSGSEEIDGYTNIGAYFAYKDNLGQTYVYNQSNLIGTYDESEVSSFSDILIINGGTETITKKTLFYYGYHSDEVASWIYNKAPEDVQREFHAYNNYHGKTKAAQALALTFAGQTAFVGGLAAAAPAGGASAGASWTQPTYLFWSGKNASAAAAEYAAANGGRILGQGLGKEFKKRMTYEMWKAYSKSFAQNAGGGQAHVFMSASQANPGSIFLTQELPVLLERGFKIVFHVVK